jgi:hypothetical protein
MFIFPELSPLIKSIGVLQFPAKVQAYMLHGL